MLVLLFSPSLPVYSTLRGHVTSRASGELHQQLAAWVTSIQLLYRNERRLVFAQKISERMLDMDEEKRDIRAKHYWFWTTDSS